MPHKGKALEDTIISKNPHGPFSNWIPKDNQ